MVQATPAPSDTQRRATEVPPPAAASPTAERHPLTCAACPHRRDAHDPIGTRFCAATIAGASSRGCACVGAALLS